MVTLCHTDQQSEFAPFPKVECTTPGRLAASAPLVQCGCSGVCLERTRGLAPLACQKPTLANGTAVVMYMARDRKDGDQGAVGEKEKEKDGQRDGEEEDVAIWH